MLAVSEEQTKVPAPVCLCPWLENPHRLVSLLDMILKYPGLFLNLTQLLAQLEVLGKPPYFPKDLTKEEQEAWNERSRESLRIGMTVCDQLNLSMSKIYVADAIKDWEAYGLPYLVEAGRIAELDKLLRNEIDQVEFFHVPALKSNYYNAQAVFGVDVKERFPSAQFDAKEAGTCYALSRSTACVFHLMRVLEIGLTVIASHFGVASDHTNWQNIIEGIEKSIRSMASDPKRTPDWKDHQEFYSQAGTHLMLLKDAWRNYTAHARGKYTEEEAELIFIQVRAFMQKLATRLHE
jgi:hypothetical protein